MIVHEHKIINPFNDQQHIEKIDVSEQIEKAEFEVLKKFIIQHLKIAFNNNELVQADDFKKGQLQYLIVQMYQPSTHITLISKLLKYNDSLHDVKEYNDVLRQLKCLPEEKTVGTLIP